MLELSGKIYDNPGVINSVISSLSARKCKKQPPRGVVLVISADKLINHDYTYIRTLSQKTRSFVEQLSLHLHHNIPVFIVISGCEHISGYSVLAQKSIKNMKNGIQCFGQPINQGRMHLNMIHHTYYHH